ncbi:maltooligosyl trehalose synthase [Nakamurella panacisegetis]|uniref:Maltooligosyl trehalose synthase n=1 Tax=Nakamurella panacisegetis TaxID=1090615 RepID=A0A1H0S112_9ACTN|nr:malto-oligosyltrehalose synthase [Nakamurella panacisegetis]SDP35259.1 maltooligosyl trehalose synthase [Nakamurella panacisegetis]
MTGPRIPRSTYRLQITADNDLHGAAAKVPYLARLGVDWAYLSPILESEPGSDHGYDVVDHGRTDTARGDRGGLAAFSDAAHSAGLGVLADIVPNHVGVATPKHSLWWWDVLAKGPASEFAHCFDIDWEFGHGRLRVPVLGDGDAELDALKIEGNELVYYEHRFPIADGTSAGSAREVHDRQHYELVNYRRADAELNYRRFFAVSTLAGIRVELPDVFASSHSEIKAWFEQGWVDGLRVDHPDGLADPAGYLRMLRALVGPAYVLVEKILEGDERLPADWECHGTTGYDALAILDRLFVDPAGETALDELDAELRGGAYVDWTKMTGRTKRAIADGILRSEVLRLARLAPDVPDAADALAELLSSFAVYRTYLPDGRSDLDAALATAIHRRPRLASSLETLADRLRAGDTELATRFQQTSGMVMAKGVEDTAFYRWTRLTSLTEVGAEPSEFAVTPTRFHQIQALRATSTPHTMTTLSTHDTKRGEDVRARISVISEMPDDWAEAVRRWNRRAPLADGPLANLLWQAVIGAWPASRERLHAYAEKAAREAGTSTGWIDADQTFETTMHRLVDAVFDDVDLHADLAALAARLIGPGRSNSLSAKLLQLLGPGVPDVYQGTELWEDSLVDPDNRRPVDHRVAESLLQRIDGGWLPPVDDSGAAKLHVVSAALRLRRDRPDLFSGYAPLVATGEAADHLVAFDRGGVIAVGTRLPVGLAERGGWADTWLTLPPGTWTDVLRGAQGSPLSGGTPVEDLLATYPVALLVRKG